MNIIEVGQIWVPKESEKLNIKNNFLFDFDYIQIITLVTLGTFFVFFIKENKIICTDHLSKNTILSKYTFDEFRTNNEIIREII